MEFGVDFENERVSIITQDALDQITLRSLAAAIQRQAETYYIDDSRLWACEQILDAIPGRDTVTFEFDFFDDLADTAEKYVANNPNPRVNCLVEQLKSVRWMKGVELVIPDRLPPNFEATD